MQVRHEPPWLIADLGAPHAVLSWSLSHPGTVTASRIAFREVRDADLPVDLDVRAWLGAEAAAAGLAETPVLLTSRTLARYELTRAEVDGVAVDCLATVGLSNAERIGHRRAAGRFGTINLAVRVSDGLTDAARLEALSIAVEARTAAVMDVGPELATGRATGTGTDCVALAAPVGDTGYAGLHTALGEAVGRAVYDAVHRGAAQWMQEPQARL